MGRRIRAQRIGRGSPTYKARSSKVRGEVELPSIPEGGGKASVLDILHDPCRTAPIARVRYSDGQERLVLAPEGIKVGDVLECGISASIKPGNTLSLGEIPEGTPIHNVEPRPGAGGKFARSAGCHAVLIAHDAGQAVLQMPSGETRSFDPRCRATIGVVGGGGRKEKPLVKAGKAQKASAARGKLYPRVSGVAMNAVDHPYGSGRGRHAGRPKTVSRNAPPGQKAGLLAARRTGRR